MAPSPELGQPKPKAPDKVDTKQCSIDGTIVETDTLKSTNATQQFENLGSLDDSELRKLLDEAITYKRPKDREHKSEIFRELLQNAEQEDKARITSISSRILGRSVRGSNRHTQGGSLQDLVETVKQDQLLESDCLIGSHSRRQHNSRQKKYSLVSTRQREGGSLPSNVNCNPYEEQFSNDFGKRGGIKNEKTILISGSVTSRQDCNNRADDSQFEGKVNHTVIEIGDGDIDETSHLLAHDSLAQDPHSSDEGTELNPMKKLPRLPINYTTHQYLDLQMMSEVSRIDKTVQFNSLKNSNKSTDNNAIQLNSSYPAVNSCIDSKSVSGLPMGPNQNAKFATFHNPQNILIEQKHTDENGNAVQSFNSTLQSTGQLTKHKDGKKKRTERNIKSTIAAKDIEGNRGGDSIDELISFIENRDTRKNGVINNSVTKAVLPLDKKSKKSSAADNKKENSGNNKLKKYNSLENLKSTSKMEEENAQSENVRENAVVLRHKQQMKKAAEMKENNKQQHQKRGERRSWGTEELTYLGDTNSIVKEANSRENEQIRKATKDCQKTSRKKDEQCEPSVSANESTPNDDFRMVTKKKKQKKKPEDMRPKQYNCPSQHPHMHGRLRYQSSHNYSNNRDAYLTPFNANDNRRKSTSSVPPSEKSDNSDLDSVHSLPIEPTTRSNNNSIQQSPMSTNSNTQAASYAEIARISQQDKSILATSLDKWPTVSSGKNPESPDNSNVSTCSTLSAKSHSSGRGNKFFPEPNEMTSNAIPDAVLTNSTRTPTSNVNVPKAISYSQSLTEDKQKSFDASNSNEEIIRRATNSLSVAPSKIDVVVKAASDTSQKNPLQKSKSVDNDNYVNMNIENYPALEKTVKPQKQYQSMPAVQANNINANQSSVAISSTKSTSKPTKSSSQSQSPTVVKPIDSNVTNSSKKTRSTSINLANQTPPKEKHHSDGSPDSTLNQIDRMNAVKTDVIDVGFDGMIQATSTTKKSNKTNYRTSNTTTSNRPAVIFNSNKYDNVSPLLFGDFNEDEVRQWDQDPDQSLMPTNHHYDQTNQTTLSQKTSLQPITVAGETKIANDKLLSPQSDLGYSSLNTITSVDPALDVASNQSNVKYSFSSIEQDQSNNNNTEPILNNSCNSVNSNHRTDDALVKHQLNVNNANVQPSPDKITLVGGRELSLRYIEPPPMSNLEKSNHEKLVNFIGSAWEDIQEAAVFYNGQ